MAYSNRWSTNLHSESAAGSIHIRMYRLVTRLGKWPLVSGQVYEWYCYMVESLLSFVRLIDERLLGSLTRLMYVVFVLTILLITNPTSSFTVHFLVSVLLSVPAVDGDVTVVLQCDVR
ncbi:hypothetical protein CBL_20903, partial [Carabus blaptoides fortunei]